MALTYFTFGQDHMTNFPLPNGGRLADYWVTVECDDPMEARSIFVERFTSKYCPRPAQFAFEYRGDEFKPEYFPKGELHKLHG